MRAGKGRFGRALNAKQKRLVCEQVVFLGSLGLFGDTAVIIDEQGFSDL